jgi:hypothetical protein
LVELELIELALGVGLVVVEENWAPDQVYEILQPPWP